MTRLRSLFQGAIIDLGVDTTAGGSFTVSAPGFANLPAVAAPDTLAIAVDPDGENGAPEVMWVTAHTAGAATLTATAAQEGTSGRVHRVGEYVVHGPTPADVLGLIGLTNYTPGSDSAYTISSTIFVDVDAVNLAVAFSAPPSGKVLVTLVDATTASGSINVFWCLREATTNIGSQLVSASGGVGSGVAEILVTGLTAASSHTYKWGARVASGSVSMNGGPTYGAHIMKVWAVNL